MWCLSSLVLLYVGVCVCVCVCVCVGGGGGGSWFIAEKSKQRKEYSGDDNGKYLKCKRKGLEISAKEITNIFPTTQYH